MASNLINVFKVAPKELFRVNNGRGVRLREWSVQRQRSYDIISEAGKVKAKALEPKTYSAPNGASMRPNSEFQKRLVSSFRGNDIVIYAIAAGTRLPEDLILVHEHTDHYSLQAAREMTVQELNDKITTFLESYGRMMSREQWVLAYTTAKETAGASSASPRPSSDVASKDSAEKTAATGWVWDEKVQKYRYWDGQKWVWQ